MRRLLAILLAGIASQSIAQAPESLTELVEAVREGTSARRAELAEREQRFIEARDERATLLGDARRQREQAEAEADRLRLEYERGEAELADLEDQLDERSGDLQDVFAVVNQVATDVQPIVQNSMVSAQFGERMPLLEKLGGKDSIPTAVDLRNLWLLLLEEMNESGRVARFEVPIITAKGEEETRRVTRIGTFTAVADGEYLRFLPESGRLLALARQPSGIAISDTRAFEQAGTALTAMALDPSRGAILSLIVQTPELRERVEQGGIIGYIIIALGVIGLALGIERLLHVGLASRKARRALTTETPDGQHAISQLQRIARDPDFLADAEAMSAKMDEVVTSAAQGLTKGLPTLAIFAAVSPLLGLLGTVTGMIETFQVITLFGAGDPRLMSGGISQALITTQLGLAVAIPLLLIHSFVQSRANGLITRLDEIAADLFSAGRAGNVVHAG